ncbi:MAG: glycine--tRNA ligase [Thermoplasmataceae archaeon]
MSDIQEIIEIAKRRGFFWQSSGIYGGVSGLYTYGPLGSILKRNIVSAWADSYISIGALLVDSPVIAQEDVFRASGHLERFTDLIYECSNCKFRQKFETLLEGTGKGVPSSAEEAMKIVSSSGLKCGNCGSDKIAVTDFNLMFPVGTVRAGESRLFLRPETAQGIFVDFQLLIRQNRDRLPLIVIQTGEGFRNEVAPRNAIIRLREFSMGEVEVFMDPESHPFTPDSSKEPVNLMDRDGKDMALPVSDALSRGIVADPAMAFFIQKTHRLLTGLGIDPGKLRFRQHRRDELAHYSSDCWDAEALMDDTWIEIVGISDRGTYDLTRHQSHSGKSMEVKIGDKTFIPKVLEPAHGIDRILMATLVHSRRVTDKGYVVMSLKKEIAPYKLAIFPLFKKDGLSEIAVDIFSRYSKIDPYCIYDESGSIGKRYARQDEAGTPYCVTVDYQTKDDHTVTIRERDSGKQKRILIDDLVSGPVLGNKYVISAFD